MNRLLFIIITFLLIGTAPLLQASASIELDISQNQVGMPPQEMLCKYNDVTKRVHCVPKDSNAPHAPEPRTFLNVFVRKTTDQNMGINLIGTYPNRQFTDPSVFGALDFNFYVFKDSYIGFQPIDH